MAVPSLASSFVYDFHPWRKLGAGVFATAPLFTTVLPRVSFLHLCSARAATAADSGMSKEVEGATALADVLTRARPCDNHELRNWRGRWCRPGLGGGGVRAYHNWHRGDDIQILLGWCLQERRCTGWSHERILLIFFKNVRGRSSNERCGVDYFFSQCARVTGCQRLGTDGSFCIQEVQLAIWSRAVGVAEVTGCATSLLFLRINLEMLWVTGQIDSGTTNRCASVLWTCSILAIWSIPEDSSLAVKPERRKNSPLVSLASRKSSCQLLTF